MKIESVKQKIHDAQGHAIEQQKLIFSGRILENAKTIDSYEIKEKDFLVVMVSKPKAAAKTEQKEAAPDASKAAPEDKPQEASKDTTEAEAATKPPADTPASSEAPAGSSSFLSGPDREAAVNNIVEMGFPVADVERAMRLSFNNPDRAVEHLMNGLPAESAEPAPPSTPAQAPAPTTAPGAPARSGNLFEQAAAQAAQGDEGGEDAEGRQMIDLGNPQVLGQLRSLVEQNPTALQPLIQALVQSNPQLAEALSADPEGVLRLLGGDEGAESMEGEESFEVPSLQQLSEEDRGQVEQIMAMGIPESKAIESYFMCGRNLEMAVQYYFENPQDFDD